REGQRRGWEVSRPSLRELRPILTTGGVVTVRTLFLTGTLTVATAVAASLGAEEVAAHQVVAQVWLLLSLTVDALAIAAQAMVADELGKADPGAADAVSRRLATWGLAFGVFLAFVVFFGRGVLAAVFGPDAEVAALIERAA